MSIGTWRLSTRRATLIAWCAAAGAWGVNNVEAAEALYTYGLSVGTAFQITDDVLDYTGKTQHGQATWSNGLNER